MNSSTPLTDAAIDAQAAAPAKYSKVAELAGKLEIKVIELEQVIQEKNHLYDISAKALRNALEQLETKNKALKIINADIHALNLEWFEKQSYDTCVLVIKNIRKWCQLGLNNDKA